MAVAEFTKQFLANIPSVYCRTLKDFYEKLLNTPTVYRIDFLSHIIDGQSGYLPNIKWTNGKNDETSQHFRILGNKCFVKLEYVEALKHYNRALAHAKSGKDLGVCYANRSAVYYELEMYKLCLENIQSANQHKLNETLKTKLEQRQQSALSQLLSTPSVNLQQKYNMKLSRPPKKDLPFFVDCLSKPNSHIITTQPLMAGEVISLERPYSQILSYSHIYERCTYCLSNKKYLSMFPCRHCSSAMFCNSYCHGMAAKIFHNVECSIIDGLYHFLPDAMYLGLRTVLISLVECHGSFDEYRSLLMKCFDNEMDSFDVSKATSNGRTMNEMVFMVVHNLNRSFKHSMQHHLATAVLMEKLKWSFERHFQRDESAALVLSTAIFHMLQVSTENSILLEETAFSGDGVGNDITIYGRGLFPFASQLKLECAPNVLFLNNGNGMMSGIVLHPIRVDEEIVPGIMSRNHFLTDRHRRNDRTQRFDNELCHCSACQEDFELCTKLPPFMTEQGKNIPLMPETFADDKEIFVALKLVCSFLNKSFFPSYLSMEIGMCTQEMIRLLRQIVEAHDTDIMFTEYSKFIRKY